MKKKNKLGRQELNIAIQVKMNKKKQVNKN